MNKKEYLELFDVVIKLNNNLKKKATSNNSELDVYISLSVFGKSEDYLEVSITIHSNNVEFPIYNSNCVREGYLNNNYGGRIYYDKSNTLENWTAFITRRWKEVRESFYNLTIPNNYK
jgi:hypothetical protein